MRCINMSKKKALHIYSSITGNTKQIAEAFGAVTEEYGFVTDYVKIDAKSDFDKNPVIIEEYDLVTLGSPIIAGLPFKELSMVMGLQGTNHLCGSEMMKEKMQAGAPVRKGIPGIVSPAVGSGAPGAKGDPDKTVYGISYVTYGGSGVGPEEAIGSIEVLTEYLRCNNVRTVGKFSCPGKELRHESVDMLADKFGCNIDEAQDLMQRYLDDPDNDEFSQYSQEQLKILKKHANTKDGDSFGKGFRMLGDNDPLGCGKPGCAMWHYDFDHRPSSRDISKAKIFISEIIEDYFLTLSGDPRAPYSTYVCLS